MEHMETWNRERGKYCVFIGSSVCDGYGADDFHGWAYHVADRMRKFGWHTFNCAIGGQTTSDVLLRLHKDVIVHKPAVCFVGLGLANEGLIHSENPDEQYYVFTNNLLKIARYLEREGIYVILGGVYPNGEISEEKARYLTRADALMDSWGYPVIHWLEALSDGHGRFKSGLEHDPYHPNNRGYEIMAEQVPDTLWRLLECE